MSIMQGDVQVAGLGIVLVAAHQGSRKRLRPVQRVPRRAPAPAARAARAAIALGGLAVEAKFIPAVADGLASLPLEPEVEVSPAVTPALLHHVPAHGLELAAEVAEVWAVRVAPYVAVPAPGWAVEEAGVGLVVHKEDAAEVLRVPLGLVLF